MTETKPFHLSKQELIDMDYGQKQNMLLIIAQRELDLREEFVQVSGRYAEIKAELSALKHASQLIQSELKATQAGQLG